MHARLEIGAPKQHPSLHSTNAERPSIALPIAALVSLFLCFPLGTILSIVSFVKHRKAIGSEARTLSIVALVANVIIVPMIAGILAAIAIPNYLQFQCRSKQSEAKMNLRALSTAQVAFHAERGEYSRDLAAIGFAPYGATVRYDYVVLDADKGNFHAEARGKPGDMAGDLWTLDAARIPTHVASAGGAPLGPRP